MTMQSRRGFLKLLTKVSVAIAAAPAVNTLTKFVAPPPELEAVYSHLASFHEMLNEYRSTEMMMAELNKDN